MRNGGAEEELQREVMEGFASKIDSSARMRSGSRIVLEEERSLGSIESIIIAGRRRDAG